MQITFNWQEYTVVCNDWFFLMAKLIFNANGATQMNPFQSLPGINYVGKLMAKSGDLKTDGYFADLQMLQKISKSKTYKAAILYLGREMLNTKI